jgi:hypothetical protein
MISFFLSYFLVSFCSCEGLDESSAKLNKIFESPKEKGKFLKKSGKRHFVVTFLSWLENPQEFCDRC